MPNTIMWKDVYWQRTRYLLGAILGYGVMALVLMSLLIIKRTQPLAVYQYGTAGTAESASLHEYQAIAQELDVGQVEERVGYQERVDRVRRFFLRYNAPLASEAASFVEAADTHKIDYRLLPAISMVESTGGKFTFRANNPFGWGSRGYSSWREAIFTVAKGIRNGYYDKGARTPYQIAPLYNPVTPLQWGAKVARLMGQI